MDVWWALAPCSSFAHRDTKSIPGRRVWGTEDRVQRTPYGGLPTREKPDRKGCWVAASQPLYGGLTLPSLHGLARTVTRRVQKRPPGTSALGSWEMALCLRQTLAHPARYLSLVGTKNEIGLATGEMVGQWASGDRRSQRRKKEESGALRSPSHSTNPPRSD